MNASVSQYQEEQYAACHEQRVAHFESVDVRVVEVLMVAAEHHAREELLRAVHAAEQKLSQE